MKVLGMTGGVGCGKSTVCRLMKEQWNAAVIYTDEVAKKLMEKGQISYNCILQYYGEQILQEDGEINRQKLAQIIFSSEEERKRVNSFSHPYVKEYVLNRIKELKEAGNNRFIVVETALPIEACLTEFCDDIIYVTASDEVKRERLRTSRGYSDERITNMLKSQLKDETFRKICTKVLVNDGSLEDITRQLKTILEY